MTKYEWLVCLSRDGRSLNAEGELSDGSNLFSGTVDEAEAEAKRRALLWIMSHDLLSPPNVRFYCRRVPGYVVISFDSADIVPPGVAELMS